ncbi:MAG: Sugar phosphate permease [Promethearchaeota archaeon]|nr:MAG: Sugar phosphate permease [Candidatus Lokiarchaeota archaeon]
MSEKEVQVYGYRWIILLLFMFSNITMQILWISYGAVTIEATTFYGVDEISILLLSLIFMIVYIPVNFLASWVIDKYNLRIGAGIGAILAGVFGFLRFLAGRNYEFALIFQIGIAIGQPFILNSITKLSANWFPESERTTATGLSLISQFIGIALGLFITPMLLVGTDLSIMLLTYGVLSLVSGILFVVFVKAEPPTPPSKRATVEKVFMFDGIKKIFTNKYFLILVVLFFVGLGAFNMITTYIELILAPRGYNALDAGLIGAIMLLGGIIGCVVMSALSDKYKKRKILILTSVSVTTVSLAILSFTADELLLYMFGFLLGFGILSAGPVALEYAVEITAPVPEATSNGALMMVGQIGGIIFILGLVDFTTPTGDYLPALIFLTSIAFVLVILSLLLKETDTKNN